MTQYDDLADDYQVARERLPMYGVLQHSLLKRLGDVSGMSVLDLACGDGVTARLLARRGTRRVLAIDSSSDQIRLADEEEARHPLGIEYRVGAAQDLEGLGEFDLVTAVFLLNYAESVAQLQQMCGVICDHLAPGGRFLAINDNGGVALAHPDGLRKYGTACRGHRDFEDGDPATLELQVGDDQWIEIEVRSFRRATYEMALRAAGFRTVNWIAPTVPRQLEQAYGADFWSVLLEVEPVVLIEAVKDCASSHRFL